MASHHKVQPETTERRLTPEQRRERELAVAELTLKNVDRKRQQLDRAEAQARATLERHK